jgi:hypothetical protein
MIFSFFRRFRRKGRGGSAEPSSAAPNFADDDMDWFWPPHDVHDSALWDRYWHDQVTHGLAPPLFDMFCHDASLIRCLKMRNVKTILCAGNGISQEPRALAAAGFEVVALDLSPEAAHLAQAWQFGSEELDRFCDQEQRAPGGAATYVTGDVLDPSLCPGPFDAIIERRTLQLFPVEERGAAFDRLVSRLRSDGFFLSHCHDGGWRPPDEPIHHVEQVFRDRGWPMSRGAPPMEAGRVAWLVMSTG